MNLKPKDVFLGVEISEIRKMNALAGENTLNLGIGQLPNDLPSPMIERGVEAYTQGQTRYTSNQGNLDLRTLIAEYHSEKSGKSIDPDQIVVTNGAEGALWNILYTYLECGDEILFPEISFSAYQTIADLQGAESSLFKIKDDFSIDFDDLKSKLNKKTKFVLINSPNNPTGQIISDEDIRSLCALAKEYKFFIISDEIYSELYHGDKRPLTPLKFSERVIVVDGISKRAAATGLRIGWTLSSKEIAKPMVVANQYIATCATSTSQYAAVASLNSSCDSFVQSVRDDLREKGEYAYNVISSIPGVTVEKPQGAFYIFPNISTFGKSKKVSKRILDEVDVLTIPGVAFGKRGDDFIRLSFAVDFDILKEALNRVKELLTNWS